MPFIEESLVSEDAIAKYYKPNNDDAYSGTGMDALNELKLQMYLCPSDGEIAFINDKFDGTTKNRRGMSYVGVLGSYFARVGNCPTTKTSGKYCIACSGCATGLSGVNNYDGLLIQGWPVALKKVNDGTSKTLLIGERWYQARAWMIGAYWSTSDSTPPVGPQPTSLSFNCKNLSDKVPINHNLNVSAYQLHVNGTDRPTVPSTSSLSLSLNNLPFASFHTGGVNFSYGDGSVKWMPDDIDTKLYLALGSRNGDETVSE